VAGWSLDPLVLASIGLVGLAYARRARTLARRGRPVSTARRASFYAGLALLLVALASPIDTIGERRLFWVHMSQHLLIGDLAPLLLVLGLDRALLRPLLALPGIGRLRALAHPLPALAVWTLALCVWHLPVLYEAALAHDGVHVLEHQCFLVGGLLMWAAVVEPLPGPAWFGSGWKAAYVLVVRTISGALASAFIWSGRLFYPDHYRSLADQAAGGALMLVEGSVVTLVVFAWLFLRWSREAELRQSLEEAGHGPLAAARAARYRRSALAMSAAPRGGPPARRRSGPGRPARPPGAPGRSGG
jgi:cytochrome c oxidase assembly factor CtaG